jgi:tRNA pseudouridine55 synthase
MDQHFDGILLIDKPSGWSSFDVVAKVRGTLKRATGKKIKVGHTGTLDPLATGLMIVVVGTYCKRAQEFSKLDKTYDVTMTLGLTSETDDEEGAKTIINDVQPTQQALEVALGEQTGLIMQTPPIYSAIKIDGKRAYDLARKGKAVKIEPRQVTVHDITLHQYEYPNVVFTTSVSSGTYIRSMVRDIGESLTCGAYMSQLRRTVVGEYSINDSAIIDPQTVEAESIYQSLQQVH